MNIKRKIVFIFIISFSLFLTGCSTIDPQPYLFPRNPLPTLEEQVERRREVNEYILQHPELTNLQRSLIECGTIGEGLLKEHVLFLRDRQPDKVEKTNLKYNADEMWFYRGVKWNNYFYFKDGVLIKIDHSR